MRNWNDSLFGTVSIIGKGPVLGFFFCSSFSSSCGSVSMENGKKVKGRNSFISYQATEDGFTQRGITPWFSKRE